MAARAVVTESALPRLRGISFIFSVFILSLAIGSTASYMETIAVRAIVVLSSLTTIILLARWRYSLHLLGMVFAMIAIGLLFFHVYSHSVLGWTSVLAYCGLFIYWAWHLWKLGSPFGATRGQKWQKERSQVREWLKTLESQIPLDRVLEVPAGSFWTGYITYRLLKDGNYWAVAKFRNGYRYGLIDYRVHDKEAVRISEFADGHKLEIGNRFKGRRL